MIKMTSEKGVAFAVQYFRTLIPHIHADLAGREDDDKVTNLDMFIKGTVSKVESSTISYFSRHPKPPFRPGEGKGQQNQGGKYGAKGKSGTNATALSNAIQKSVCIYHDPLAGKNCRHGQHCQFRHVDTRNKTSKREFDEATREVARRKMR